MPGIVCVMLLLMSTQAAAATLADLHWMVGSWTGSLGPQTVEESWSKPRGGTMSTMIRLTSDDATIMIELISIREEGESLVLHLRQFSPALEERLSQDMPLEVLSEDSVRFKAQEGAAIPALTYRRTGPEGMEVDVTIADGNVVTATLIRN